MLARTTRSEYAPVIGGIVEWLRREMTAPDGAFFSALDADSEHEEGKFYVWHRDEVRALLSAEEFAVVEPHYGFDRPPNFEHVAWNPIVATALDQLLPPIYARALLIETLRIVADELIESFK